ncbi:MAG: helix-hairpin-helix domain-containing protein [Pseudomonadota bacterium]|nr:helix-hairpin-helix domain-containing protein [Pseudomonadota bacterium]
MFKKLLAIFAMCWAAAAWAAVDANKASEAELTTVKGIGPAMSATIVQERAKAPFKDWQDFKARVKGVGDKNAPRLSDGGLTINGAAYGTAITKPAARSTKPAAPLATPAKPAAK